MPKASPIGDSPEGPSAGETGPQAGRAFRLVTSACSVRLIVIVYRAS